MAQQDYRALTGCRGAVTDPIEQRATDTLHLACRRNADGPETQ
ncbi:hypothetical protein GCM10023166_33620 [Paeniglutamicibacter cryotolerans]|uniref:Uncharacterized protein n=1 Tax=Paeniglutamicibacter cryotolerans TaxID=670079 RepID=A0A839QSZ3_9MICC|nr:hypothetical protein [Paeniglutamicibacter cryotolerans]